MQTYKNLSNQPLIIPNVGIATPGGTVDSEFELNNQELQPITNQTAAVPEIPVPEPAPVQAAPEPPKEGEH